MHLLPVRAPKTCLGTQNKIVVPVTEEERKEKEKKKKGKKRERKARELIRLTNI